MIRRKKVVTIEKDAFFINKIIQGGGEIVYRVENTITINVAPERVLEALEDIEGAPEWVPSLNKVWDIQGKGAGCTYNWQYKMGAVRFKGTTEITESTPQRFIMRTQGGVPSFWTWTMLPVRGRTVLNLVIEYELPDSLVGSLANNVLENQTRKNLLRRWQT